MTTTVVTESLISDSDIQQQVPLDAIENVLSFGRLRRIVRSFTLSPWFINPLNIRFADVHLWVIISTCCILAELHNEFS